MYFADEQLDLERNNLKATRKTTRIRRKHTCMYCDSSVTNFARHLERTHADEMDVQRFMSLNKKDPERKNLIGKLRKEGDFCTGKPVPVLRSKTNCTDNNITGLLPCIYCKGENCLLTNPVGLVLLETL